MDVLTHKAEQTGVDRGWRGLVRWSSGALAGNMLLILTGALVRLTESGLGCPTWPKCTAESLIPEGMGLHGAIEFGNRMLTFLLAALAIGTYVAARRVLDQGQPRRDLRALAFWTALGVPMQAVIGGITVLTQLNPYVVGLHLIVSVTMIAFLVLLVRRARRIPHTTVSPRGRVLISLTFWLIMLSVVLGVLVTGSAPHSGDPNAARTGFTLEIVAKAHAWTVLIALVPMLWALVETRAKIVGWVVLCVAAQALVGYLQYFNGLPVWIVTLHMIGVAVVSALTANMYWSARVNHGTDTQSETIFTNT